MTRESGVLESTTKDGVEMRLHRFRRPRGEVMRRIPWHKDYRTGEWYSGIEGPEIEVYFLTKVVEDAGFVVMRE